MKSACCQSKTKDQKCPNIAKPQKQDALSQKDLYQKYLALYQSETDEQLYQRLRDMAAQLGRLPTKAEVPACDYLKARLGSWPIMMEHAGLKPVGQKRRHKQAKKKKHIEQ